MEDEEDVRDGDDDAVVLVDDEGVAVAVGLLGVVVPVLVLDVTGGVPSWRRRSSRESDRVASVAQSIR